jgi:hypothetical protein
MLDLTELKRMPPTVALALALMSPGVVVIIRNAWVGRAEPLGWLLAIAATIPVGMMMLIAIGDRFARLLVSGLVVFTMGYTLWSFAVGTRLNAAGAMVGFTWLEVLDMGRGVAVLVLLFHPRSTPWFASAPSPEPPSLP